MGSPVPRIILRPLRLRTWRELAFVLLGGVTRSLASCVQASPGWTAGLRCLWHADTASASSRALVLRDRWSVRSTPRSVRQLVARRGPLGVTLPRGRSRTRADGGGEVDRGDRRGARSSSRERGREARPLDLRQARDRARRSRPPPRPGASSPTSARPRVSGWRWRSGTGSRRNAADARRLGGLLPVDAAMSSGTSRTYETERPTACPQCETELVGRCPSCDARLPSAFQVECEECGAPLRENELFGGPIRRAGAS
jgi:hypothetical protein